MNGFRNAVDSYRHGNAPGAETPGGAEVKLNGAGRFVRERSSLISFLTKPSRPSTGGLCHDP
jgi:hypothetical protein